MKRNSTLLTLGLLALAVIVGTVAMKSSRKSPTTQPKSPSLVERWNRLEVSPEEAEAIVKRYDLEALKQNYEIYYLSYGARFGEHVANRMKALNHQREANDSLELVKLTPPTTIVEDIFTGKHIVRVYNSDSKANDSEIYSVTTGRHMYQLLLSLNGNFEVIKLFNYDDALQDIHAYFERHKEIDTELLPRYIQALDIMQTEGKVGNLERGERPYKIPVDTFDYANFITPELEYRKYDLQQRSEIYLAARRANYISASNDANLLLSEFWLEPLYDTADSIRYRELVGSAFEIRDALTNQKVVNIAEDGVFSLVIKGGFERLLISRGGLFEVVNITDLATAHNLLEEYCREHPNISEVERKQYFKALNTLNEKSKPAREKTLSDPDRIMMIITTQSVDDL